MALTGRFRFRRSLMGSVILQLEHDKWAPWPLSIGGKRRRCWRDASIVDLLAPQIHGLVGLEHFVEEFPNANHGALTPPLARRRLPQRELPQGAAGAGPRPDATDGAGSLPLRHAVLHNGGNGSAPEAAEPGLTCRQDEPARRGHLALGLEADTPAV